MNNSSDSETKTGMRLLQQIQTAAAGGESRWGGERKKGINQPPKDMKMMNHTHGQEDAANIRPESGMRMTLSRMFHQKDMNTLNALRDERRSWSQRFRFIYSLLRLLLKDRWLCWCGSMQSPSVVIAIRSLTDRSPISYKCIKWAVLCLFWAFL